MDLSASRSALEAARCHRLRSLGVSEAALKASVLKPLGSQPDDCIRVMQWNLLADGMSDDGFLVRDVLQDWPAGIGNVPTSDGKVVKFDSLLTQMIAARGDSEALETLKSRYSVAEAERNADVIVDWTGRELQIQLQVIAAGRPDFLVFQECDHYGPLSKGLAKLGYSSALPSAEPVTEYEPAHLIGLSPHTAEGAKGFKDAIEAKGHAFLPNTGSAAMNLKLNKDGNRSRVLEAAKKLGVEDQLCDVGGAIKRRSFCGFATGPLLDEAQIDRCSIDDDGVAIFWRIDRWSAASLDVRLFPSGKGGALQVRLREQSCPARHLILIGVHLSSGDDPLSEARRLSEQVDPAGGLRDIVQEAQASGEPVVLSMDANSHPQIGAESDSSVWCSLHGALGASVWDSHFDARGRLLSDAPPDPPVTSNKLRGPLSLQSKKIGLHSYYCIDHVFFNPAELSMAGHALPPEQFSSEVEARGVLNPSLSCPSDHYPVVVDLCWPLRGPAAQLKVASSQPASTYARTAAEMLRGTEDKEPIRDLYISAIGSAIAVAAEVANRLESDGLVKLGRIHTDYQDMREAKPRKGSLWCPRIVIMVQNAKVQ